MTNEFPLRTSWISACFAASAALAGCGESRPAAPSCTPSCGSYATCVSTSTGDRCVCDVGYTGDGYTCAAAPDMGVANPDTGVPDMGVAPCDPATDPDFHMVELPIRTITPDPVGYNLDGRDTPTLDGGIEFTYGCNFADAPNGADRGFHYFADQVNDPPISAIAVYEGLSSAATTSALTVRITHLSATDVASDSCVGVEIVSTVSGSTTVSSGSGTLLGHRLVAEIRDGITIRGNLRVLNPNYCSLSNPSCSAPMRWSSHVNRFDLPLAVDNQSMLAGATWAGAYFLEDSTARVGFLEDFYAWGRAAYDDYVGEHTLLEMSEDLHMNTMNVLEPCQSPGDRNAMAFSYLVSSQ